MSDQIFKEFDKLHAKVDKLSDKMDYVVDNVGEMKVTAARHEENLKDHMRRSDLLEKRTDVLFEELEPVKKHINHVDGIMKFVAAISMLLGLIYTVLKLFSKI